MELASSQKSAGLQLKECLNKVFGFEKFRPFQEKICETILKGQDSLVVMPTGQGKSLCYQIPGLVRAGTTLVISPLIALMEDQVQSLEKVGLRADRIHSARDREQSRNVCRRYLNDDLDYLFIAPERLGLPGFLNLLTKKTPSLIAIDEAHCISQWGHDFRPDYRMLAERLENFPSVPKVALTATATSMVQKDIVRQLSLENPALHIHGFRRSNIAIEAVHISSKDRPKVICGFLKHNEPFPAIIYCPTRKQTETFSNLISKSVSKKVAYYHAGMPNEDRDRIQNLFQAGELDVIVATVAFGMGIDKANIRTVIHTALPASIEGYYQEIGRGGRDGKNAHALQFYSSEDLKTLNFLVSKSYPDLLQLSKLLDLVPSEGILKEDLKDKSPYEESLTETILNKLWVHNGIKLDKGRIIKDQPNWFEPYNLQKIHKTESIEKVWQYFRNSKECRMIQITEFFGDRDTEYDPCKLCDICDEKNGFLTEVRPQTPLETQYFQMILKLLKTQASYSQGKLFTQIFSNNLVEKSLFEILVETLNIYNFISISEHSFEKNGVNIQYNKIAITYKGKASGIEEIKELKIKDIRSKFLTAKPRTVKLRKSIN